MRNILYIFVFTLFISAPAQAEEETFPQFASLKNDITNVRAGPGTRYPILWVFKKKDWPVKLLASHNYWYKIRDVEGEEGWIYKSLIKKHHTVLVSAGEPATLYKKADATVPLLHLGEGVILTLAHCTPYLCRAFYKNYDGWVVRKRLLMVE